MRNTTTVVRETYPDRKFVDHQFLLVGARMKAVTTAFHTANLASAVSASRFEERIDNV